MFDQLNIYECLQDSIDRDGRWLDRPEGNTRISFGGSITVRDYRNAIDKLFKNDKMMD
jgi:hypothetical protein